MGFVFISAVLFTLINTFVQSKSQYNKSYNFVITNIRVTPTHTLVFFKETEEIYLWNYIISDKEGVEVGDLLYKEKCSKYLYIYRKNKQGKYVEYLKVIPKRTFTPEWFCN